MVVRHRDQCIAGPHPEGATVLPGGPGQTGRHVNDQDQLPVVCVLFYRNPLMQLLEQPGLGSTRLRECSRADDASRAFVSDAKNDLAATCVGEGDAVFDQIFKMKIAPGLFELDTAPLWAGQVGAKLFDRGHAGTSPLTRSARKS